MCSAYDRAAIKFRGVEADINFSIEDYEEDLKQVCACERERFLMVIKLCYLEQCYLISYSSISDNISAELLLFIGY